MVQYSLSQQGVCGPLVVFRRCCGTSLCLNMAAILACYRVSHICLGQVNKSASHVYANTVVFLKN